VVVDRNGTVQKGTLRSFPEPWNSLMTFSGLWRMGNRYPWLRGVNQHQGNIPAVNTSVEAVSGACMLVSRDVFVRVGYMDQAYGLHCEDLDLMYRLHLQGYHCLLVPAARVIHQQGESSRSRPVWVHCQKHLGMQRFFRKFQSTNYPAPLRLLIVGGIWLRFALTLPLVYYTAIAGRFRSRR